METFLFLFVNAWELLLKAKIISDNKSEDIIKETDNLERTISFARAVKIIFTSENDPVRKNLLHIEDLRNEAAHLFILVIPPFILLVFQAGILNYERLLKQWFDYSLCDRIPFGMMFLIAEFDPKNFSEDSPIFNKQLSPESAAYIGCWQKSLREEIKILPEDQIGYFVFPIDLKLSVVSNPTKAEVLAYLGEPTDSESGIAIRYQRVIDRYQLSYTELVRKIKEVRPTATQNQISAVIRKYDIKNKKEYSEYNFRTKRQEEEYKKTTILPSGIPSLYNDKALQFILEKLQQVYDSCNKVTL
jgi:hypothetical protein